jgi:PadR family transcriptional regulator PadR
MKEQNWASQLRRGTLELSILAVLRGGESYGYDILHRLAAEGSLLVTEGTVYPLLNRLKREGDIDSRWRESPAGPPRKYYDLTHQGRQTLKAMEQEWDTLVKAIRSLRGGDSECP